ncbi:MAG: hypothetical protein CL402_08000 [Acidiferrobacteraceae bacterium]|nr:hypothetical protein [Acidiferrobacteraceae bacterium]|tara:strand:+ start:1194 stop:3251 length:2058 start_codon:yes stop_codon:yes gene_type:complete
MAKTDFTFVGQPHDPRSISGSDPYNALTSAGQEKANTIGTARLAFWYKFDPGCIRTTQNFFNHATSFPGPSKRTFPGSNFSTEGGAKPPPVEIIYDVSGNSREFDTFSNRVNSQGSETRVTRHMYRLGDNYYDGIVSGSQDNGVKNSNYRVTGDDQYFLMGSETRNSSTREVCYTSTTNAQSYRDHGENNQGYNMWVTGNITHGASVDTTKSNVMPGGYSLFTTMRYNADEAGQDSWQTDTDYPLYVSYPGTYPHDLNNSEHNTFSLGLTHDGGGAYRTLESVHRRKDNGDTIKTRGSTTDLPDTWHVLSMTYDNQTNIGVDVTSSYYVGGQQEAILKYDYNNSSAPKNENDHCGVVIGGNSATGGGDIDTSDMTTDHINGWHEFFAFDDTLSNIRRQQMEKYLSDRLELAMSSSTYLPEFDGGAAGVTFAHDQLSNALSGESQGSACRRYWMQNTGSGDVGPVKLHEVAGGAFVKSSVDSGAYYRMSSTEAVQMTMWVRAENLDDAKHDGSHVALVAKATSPFGHQMDNIKGYAMKFGTFNNGADSGNTPSFRLSLRNSDEWLDGTTSGSSSDIALSSGGFSVAADTWYQMKLEVIPAGFNYDHIKTYVRVAGGNWTAFGDVIVYNDDRRYRHWWDDNLEETKRVRTPNGTHNGYYVAMSSSDGHRLTTSYYIDEFTIKTDTVL